MTCFRPSPLGSSRRWSPFFSLEASVGASCDLSPSKKFSRLPRAGIPEELLFFWCLSSRKQITAEARQIIIHTVCCRLPPLLRRFSRFHAPKKRLRTRSETKSRRIRKDCNDRKTAIDCREGICHTSIPVPSRCLRRVDTRRQTSEPHCWLGG